STFPKLPKNGISKSNYDFIFNNYSATEAYNFFSNCENLFTVETAKGVAQHESFIYDAGYMMYGLCYSIYSELSLHLISKLHRRVSADDHLVTIRFRFPSTQTFYDDGARIVYFWFNVQSLSEVYI